MSKESAKWNVLTRLEKFKCREDYLNNRPFEVLEIPGNVLLVEGTNAMWTLICGGIENAFNASNANIGIGDSTATALPDQTGLQSTTNTAFKGMDTGFPEFGSLGKAIFKSTFIENEAVFDWEEWTVANGSNPTVAKNLNRKVESMGSKQQEATWILTVEISIA